MRRVIVSNSTDIHENLAAEACLVAEAQSTLFLWRNDASVIIGRYQNPWVECNLDSLDSSNVKLARRLSGGGAVYHDLGNLCFTFIDPKEQFSKEANFKHVIDALAGFGIQASLSGRNDILADGRKVSGSAFQVTKDAGCHHGTLLVSTDLGVLPKYLSPSKTKLESHAVKSVRSRVANLSEFNPSITTENLLQALCDGADVSFFNPSDHPQWAERYTFFSSDSWVRGNTPHFTERRDLKVNGSNVILLLDVKDGIIADATVSCDSLDAPWLEDYRQSFIGKPY